MEYGSGAETAAYAYAAYAGYAAYATQRILPDASARCERAGPGAPDRRACPSGLTAGNPPRSTAHRALLDGDGDGDGPRLVQHACNSRMTLIAFCAMPPGRQPQTEPRPEIEAAEPKIKGAAFIEILKWYTKTHGGERIHRAVAQMPPDCRQYITRPEQLTLGLLVGTWYPAALVGIVFHEMIADLTPVETRQLAMDAVRASVGTTLSGIYASFIRLLVSPSMLAEHYQKIWRLYHSTGRFYVITHSPTHQEFQLHDWPAHDSFICMMNLYATRLILEILGQKDVSGSTQKCVDRGDTYCSYVQKWK